MTTAAAECGAPGPSGPSRPARLTLACALAVVLTGLGATLWAFLGASTSLALSPALLAAAVVVSGVTVANLLLRFVRWQFLLRRLDVRLPTVPSLGAYVGSFAFLPVPLLLGQTIARVRLAGPLGPGQRTTVVGAVVLERLLDLWALTAVAALVAPRAYGVAWLLVTALALHAGVRRAAVDGIFRLAHFAAMLFHRDDPGTPDHRTRGRGADGAVLGVAAAASLAAWTPVALVVLPVVWAAGVAPAPTTTVGAVAESIVVGGVSLAPVGVGVAGLLLRRRLVLLGAPLAAATTVAFVFRATTAWLSVVLGGVSLLLLLRRNRTAVPHDHFDAIDSCYDAWLPPHYREHLVRRKTQPMLARLAPGARGLDVGCGRGWYVEVLRDGGMRMVGADVSARQLAASATHLGPSVPLVRSSVLGLPFQPGVFDFTYIVNVLHHLPSPRHQVEALQEMARVVRPGGLLFVHEMSVVNPLFRLYLSYVFPILKGIEEGTEHYLDARRLPEPPGLRLVDVRFFTFVPDFVPPTLLPALARLEAHLEAGPIARWAAHFVAVYERTA